MSQELTLNNIVKEYFSNILNIHPELGLEMDIDVSRSLPDMSLEVIEREKGLIRLTLEKLEDIDFEDLSLDGKVAYLSFRDYLRLRLFFIEDWQIWRMYPESLEILVKIIGYIVNSSRYTWEEKVVKLAEYMDDLHKFLELSKQRIKRPLKLLVELSLILITYIKQLLAYLEEEVGKDPKASKVYSKYKVRFDRAMEYLDDYKNWISNLRGKELFDISMGENLYDKLIRVRRIGDSLQSVQQLLKSEINNIMEEINRKLVIMNMSSLRDYMEGVRSVTYRDPYMIVSRYEQIFVETRRHILENNLAELPEIDLDIHVVPVKTSYTTPIFTYKSDIQDGRLKIEIYLRIKDEDDLKWHNDFEARLRVIREIIPGQALVNYYLKTSGSLLQKILDIPHYQVGWGYFVQDMMIDTGVLASSDYELLALIDKYKLAMLAKMDLEVNLGKISHSMAYKHLRNLDGIFSEDEATIGVMEVLMSPSMHLSNYLAYVFYKNIARKLKILSGENFSYRWLVDEVLKYAVTPHKYLEALILRDYAGNIIDREFNMNT